MLGKRQKLKYEAVESEDETTDFEEKKRGFFNTACVWSSLFTSVLIGTYYVPSICLTFYQRWLFQSFHFPLVTVVIHMIVKFLLATLIRAVLERKQGKQRILLEWKEYLAAVAPMGIFSGLDIGFSNWGLELIQVSLYTMTKSTTVVFILAFSMLFKLEKKSWSLAFIVGMITAGLILFTYKATQFNVFGFTLLIIASMSSGIRWTCVQLLLQKSKMGMRNPIEEVCNTIYELKNSTASGPDEINSIILKYCAKQLTETLTYIINNTFLNGKFPNLLKISKIFPTFKNGDPTKMINYRPISNLSCFSKIIEKIVVKRIGKFLDSYERTNPHQHGFTKGRSASTAIIEFLDNLYENIDNNNNCVGLFLDLSKAFDLVNHDKLLDKLWQNGVRGTAWEWFKSYLENRQHYVEISGAKSELLYVNTGVPQGSVLGPLLYLIYVSDFICKNSVMFADDTSVLVTANKMDNIANIASSKLVSLEKYFLTNNLILNNKKTKFIDFSNIHKEKNYSLLIRSNSGSIRQDNETKFLGVTLDNKLKWHRHLEELCKKVSVCCFVLKQLKKTTQVQILKTYYFACIHSQLQYGIIAWGSCSDIDRVFKLQKKVVRIIMGLNYRSSCKLYFTSEKIMTVPSIFIYNSLLYVRTHLTSFKTICENHDYSTRNLNVLKIPKHRTSLFKNSPKYMGIRLYNKLPHDIKNLNLKQFKHRVKNILIKKAYYSVNEYITDTTL